MYILREYGITFEEEDFICKEFPKSLLVERIMYKLMISNSISEVKIREEYKKIISCKLFCKRFLYGFCSKSCKCI